MKRQIQNNGLALLITMLLMSVLFGISTSLLNVTLKQYQLSGIARSSEIAFHAANAGIECLSYHDLALTVGGVSKFDVPGDGSAAPEVASISCMDNQSSTDISPEHPGTIQSGEEQRFQFEWGSPAVCTNVSIYKFHSDSGVEPVQTSDGQVFRASGCPQGSICTVIRSRGYNTGCGSLTNPRTVERELTQIY